MAQTYSALGRHPDALAMFENVLELFDRVLPDRPDMGEGHAIYPPLYENMLELRRRVLSADHPDIGMACHDLIVSYHKNMLNNKQHSIDKRALELAREALRIWQSTLPPGHNNISVAKKHISELKSMNGHGFRDIYQALHMCDDLVRSMLLPDFAAGNTSHSAFQHNFRQTISSNQADLDQLAQSLGLASASNDTRRKFTKEGDVKDMDSFLSENESDSKDSGPMSGCSCEEEKEEEEEEEEEEEDDDSRIPCLHQ
jgi:hypothetical protein